MTDDLIERAEAILALPISERGLDGESELAQMIPDFIAALKDRDEALADVRAALKAARAEIERLKSVWTTPPASKAWDGKEPWPGQAVEDAWRNDKWIPPNPPPVAPY